MPSNKNIKSTRSGGKTGRNRATVNSKATNPKITNIKATPRARKSNNPFARNSRNRGLALVGVLAIAAVLLIGIAVAAFSTDLQINGTAVIKGTTWDIHFDNLQLINKSANAEEVQAPTIKADANGENTIIGDYQVKLKYPSDHIEYVFDVANAGDMDAEITAITINSGSDLTCDYGGVTPTHNVCEKLIYTLKYNNGQTVSVGDTLVHGQTRTLALHLEFDPNASTDYLPKQDVDVSGLGVTITFSQQ